MDRYDKHFRYKWLSNSVMWIKIIKVFVKCKISVETILSMCSCVRAHTHTYARTHTCTHTGTHPHKYTIIYIYSDTENQQTRELISTQKMSHKQQRPESPTVTLTWHASKYRVHKLLLRYIFWWSLCTFCLLACQVRVTVGGSGLCCASVTSFKH